MSLTAGLLGAGSVLAVLMAAPALTGPGVHALDRLLGRNVRWAAAAQASRTGCGALNATPQRPGEPIPAV